MNITWSGSRKILYTTLFALILLVGSLFAFKDKLNPAPTCNDGKQNGIETGIDCGGGCQMVCKADYKPLTVTLAKAIKKSPGVFEILILIDNPNTNISPKTVDVTLEIYNDNGVKVKTLKSTNIGYTSKVIPIFLNDYKTESISKVVAMVDGYEMYHSLGGVDIKLKPFTFEKKASTTDIEVSYTSPYREEMNKPFGTIVAVYNSLGNLVGFTNILIDKLVPDVTKQVFISIPYVIDGDIASIKFFPMVVKYDNNQ